MLVVRTRRILLGATLLAILVFLPASAAVAAFPGGNGRIAYSGTLESDAPTPGQGRSNIFTILPDGSGTQQLTDDSDVEWQPSWSADGRSLVFVRGEPGTCQVIEPQDRTEVFKMDADGSNQSPIVDVGSCDPSPSFSPSGGRIVYATGRTIVTVRTDGTDRRRLVTGIAGFGEAVGEPTWSPGGRRIAFLGRPKGRRKGGIWTVRRNGSRLRLVAPSVGLTTLDYSPDGRDIAFFRWEDGFPKGIYLARADGSGERAIPGTDGLARPAYAPAGDRIVMQSVATVLTPPCTNLYTISPTGSDRRQITGNCRPGEDYPALPGDASEPSWQPLPASE
jgi:Tol biopolymer transport system component